MNIGVFDSGRGGEYIAAGLKKLLPEHTYVVVNDRANVPYGSRQNSEILCLTNRAIKPLIPTCPIIVIACNTATMAAITSLRELYSQTRFVGTEPMVKQAAATSISRHATLLATPRTLKSQRYRSLIDQFAADLIIDELDTAQWARKIEDNEAKTIAFDDVRSSIAAGSDTIVLACTHYIALKSRLSNDFFGVQILEPTEAIARHIVRLAHQP